MDAKPLERAVSVLTSAEELYRQQPDWITFFREVLGVDGSIRRSFQSPEELRWFEQTPQYAEIQELLAKLRVGHTETPAASLSVITIRLPNTLHKALKEEARRRKTSMNQLCISKLLCTLAEEDASHEAA